MILRPTVCKQRNMHELDLDLQNLSRSNVNMSIESL